MSFEEDSLESPSTDLLSPDSLRRRRQQAHFSGKGGGSGGLNLNIKLENAECPNKKVRFRKRAKSLVVGGISSNAEQVLCYLRGAQWIILNNFVQFQVFQ